MFFLLKGILEKDQRSRSWLSRNTGITIHYINLYYRGKYPSQDHLEKICKATNRSYLEFLSNLETREMKINGRNPMGYLATGRLNRTNIELK